MIMKDLTIAGILLTLFTISIGLYDIATELNKTNQIEQQRNIYHEEHLQILRERLAMDKRYE